MQVTILFSSTVVEDPPRGRTAMARKAMAQTYREALLVWASRYGFLPGVAVRVGVSESDALGLLRRIALRQEKCRTKVYRLADDIADGVVRFEGNSKVVIEFQPSTLLPAKGSQASDPRPRPLDGTDDDSPPEGAPPRAEAPAFPEGRAEAVSAAHA